jgi:hypothetical protein
VCFRSSFLLKPARSKSSTESPFDVFETDGFTCEFPAEALQASSAQNPDGIIKNFPSAVCDRHKIVVPKVRMSSQLTIAYQHGRLVV